MLCVQSCGSAFAALRKDGRAPRAGNEQRGAEFSLKGARFFGNSRVFFGFHAKLGEWNWGTQNEVLKEMRASELGSLFLSLSFAHLVDPLDRENRCA